jgi:hypothetical protein
MASTYADSLKKGMDPGPCGQPEIHETERAVRAKVATLARWIESSRYIVVHTGAGTNSSFLTSRSFPIYFHGRRNYFIFLNSRI